MCGNTGQSIRCWFEPTCESSNCHGEQWFVFSCSFFEFLRRPCANKLWCTTQNWPSFDAQVTCDDLWGTANVFFQHFFTNLFLWVCQIVREPTTRNLFTARYSYNIECMLVEEMPLSWRSCIAIVNNYSSFLFRFLNFAEDFRQTNCGVTLRINRATWNSRCMTSFAEKTRLFASKYFSANNFGWIWLVFEGPSSYA